MNSKAIVSFIFLAVLIVGASPPVLADPTFEDGFYVSTYPDGSGSVALSPSYSYDELRWSFDCHVDAMTDKRICVFYSSNVGIYVDYAGTDKPLFICAFGHDFPGRKAMIRVDKNQAVTTDEGGCMSAFPLMDQLLLGDSVTVRMYKWPNDWPIDTVSKLKGLAKTMEVVERIYNGG